MARTVMYDKPLLPLQYSEEKGEECGTDKGASWLNDNGEGTGGMEDICRSASILAHFIENPVCPRNLGSSRKKRKRGIGEESNSGASSSPTSTLSNKWRKRVRESLDLEEGKWSIHEDNSGDDESYKPVTPDGPEEALCLYDRRENSSLSDVRGLMGMGDVRDSTSLSELHDHGQIGAVSEGFPDARKHRNSVVKCPLIVDTSGGDHKMLLPQEPVREAKRFLNNLEVHHKRARGRKSKNDQMAARTRSLMMAIKAFEENKINEPFWQEISLSGVDYRALIGRACEVHWPLDSCWYRAVIQGHNPMTGKYKVLYEDDECEWLLLSKERVKLLLPRGECLHADCARTAPSEKRECLGWKAGVGNGTGRMTDDSRRQSQKHRNISNGDVVWGKVKGYSEWPALVLDEECCMTAGLEEANSESLIPSPAKVAVQYFGTFDISLQSRKSCRTFSEGVKASLHTKNQQAAFVRALDQVESYLTEQVLPLAMATVSDFEEAEEDEGDFEEEEEKGEEEESLQQPQMPLVIGSLTVLSLGQVVTDSEHFHSDRYIWPEGYTAVKLFPSAKDVTKLVEHRMEVLRKMREKGPVFCVTPEDGKAVVADTPGQCWKAIQRRVIEAKERLLQTDCGIPVENLPSHGIRSGPAEFGFCSQRITSFIQALPNAHKCTKFQLWQKPPVKQVEVPVGYVPQRYTWQHGDRCSVCYTHEEYEDNQLLQCDNCRTMVHMDCYGVDTRPDGDLWLCDICHNFPPHSTPPPCCLCPVQGGAMKRTSDARWAHVTCAIWIPETTFDGLEVVHGVGGIAKARWKLLCSICRVPYGACIQCLAKGCCVAYHPLCARKEGLSMEEFYDENKQVRGRGLMGSCNGDVELHSYCRRHRKVMNSSSPAKRLPCPSHSRVQISQVAPDRKAKWKPALNESGCARSEPYNSAVRRGRREPDALAAAMAKRNFLENIPYIISGCRQATLESSDRVSGVESVRPTWAPLWKSADDVSLSHGTARGDKAQEAEGFLSMSDRFRKMQGSVHARLAFGKSAIHGWGLFAKLNHKAGDMMIEYAGEVVRPIVADIRERRCYDSLVGAGTYMFRIDSERVVDATRAGSMAHLINHACEPNCYSRVIKAGKEDHIIIFAKRDMFQGEELTYDYRFNSTDELLPCNCGYRSCRGVVNIHDDDENLLAKRSEITPWDIPDKPAHPALG